MKSKLMILIFIFFLILSLLFYSREDIDVAKSIANDLEDMSVVSNNNIERINPSESQPVKQSKKIPKEFKLPERIDQTILDAIDEVKRNADYFQTKDKEAIEYLKYVLDNGLGTHNEENRGRIKYHSKDGNITVSARKDKNNKIRFFSYSNRSESFNVFSLPNFLNESESNDIYKERISTMRMYNLKDNNPFSRLPDGTSVVFKDNALAQIYITGDDSIEYVYDIKSEITQIPYQDGAKVVYYQLYDHRGLKLKSFP